MRKSAPVQAEAFIRDLLAHDMSVLATRSGKLELLVCQTVRDPQGGGYREVPRHRDTDAMKARFDALTQRERAALSDYVMALPQ